MDTGKRPLRYLFVHAHPDDETLATGVALASLARAGHDVRLLTCTLGEEGEIIPAELAHLQAGRDDALGPYRRGELRAAMAHLGVHEVVLGEDEGTRTGSAYRDSGMADTPANADPRSWVAADEATAVAALAEQLHRLRPDVVVTYDEQGGYRHPDHMTTHRRTCAAVAGMSRPPALYAIYVPADVAARDRAWLAARPGLPPEWTVPAPDDPYPPNVVDPAIITHQLTGTDEDLRRRDAALREHRTQVSVEGACYALSNLIAARLTRADYFARIDPRTGRPDPSAEFASLAEGLPGDRP